VADGWGAKKWPQKGGHYVRNLKEKNNNEVVVTKFGRAPAKKGTPVDLKPGCWRGKVCFSLSFFCPSKGHAAAQIEAKVLARTGVCVLFCFFLFPPKWLAKIDAGNGKRVFLVARAGF